MRVIEALILYPLVHLYNVMQSHTRVVKRACTRSDQHATRTKFEKNGYRVQSAVNFMLCAGGAVFRNQLFSVSVLFFAWFWFECLLAPMTVVALSLLLNALCFDSDTSVRVSACNSGRRSPVLVRSFAEPPFDHGWGEVPP